MEDKINLNDFNDLCSVLKKYDGCHITFYGKVSTDNQIGETVSSGILKVPSVDMRPAGSQKNTYGLLNGRIVSVTIHKSFYYTE